MIYEDITNIYHFISQSFPCFCFAVISKNNFILIINIPDYYYIFICFNIFYYKITILV